MENEPDYAFHISKQQTKEFIEKVRDRNKKEARLIVAFYDLKHPFYKSVQDYPDNIEKAKDEMLKNLKERKKFLDFMAEYL